MLASNQEKMKKKPRRVVLGEGFQWWSKHDRCKVPYEYCTVTLFGDRDYMDPVSLNIGKLFESRRIRLIAEVLE